MTPYVECLGDKDGLQLTLNRQTYENTLLQDPPDNGVKVCDHLCLPCIPAIQLE